MPPPPTEEQYSSALSVEDRAELNAKPCGYHGGATGHVICHVLDALDGHGKVSGSLRFTAKRLELIKKKGRQMSNSIESWEMAETREERDLRSMVSPASAEIPTMAFISRHAPTTEQVKLAEKAGFKLVHVGDVDAFDGHAVRLTAAGHAAAAVVHPAAALVVASGIGAKPVGIFENSSRAPEGSKPEFFASALHIFTTRADNFGVLQAWCDSSEPDPDDESDQPTFTYVGDGYACVSDDYGDIFITRSPFYTYAKFCSPCAPGACHLSNPDPDGDRCYCFGHDWFNDGHAPYPVYNIETDKEVFA